ncbi:MAG: helix-hairpin-helix domain-containing protein [Candidatus Roizmanbacteria bacterium]
METNKYSEIFTKLIDEIKASDDHKARLLVLLKKPIVVFTACFIAILALQWYKSTLHQSTPQNFVQIQKNPGLPIAPASSRYIYVDLSGSVVDPKVHRVPENTRLFEIVSLSGGLNEVADRAYFFRNFNQAMILNDQDKIYIPSVSEVANGVYLENEKVVSAYPQTTSQTRMASQGQNGAISINTASQAVLETLKGVGSITALRIIAGRPYKTVDELVEKDILKSALLNSIRDQLDL